MAHDTITLTTGREVYAFGGVVGLAIDRPDAELKDGAGGVISTTADEGHDPEVNTDAITPAEAVELADRMIAAWTAYRARMAALADR